MVIHEQAQLKPYAYYQTGGRCQVLYLPSTEQELLLALKDFQSRNLPYFVLGAGSNSLVLDQDYPGAVFCCRDLNHIRRVGDKIVCGAGIENNKLVEFAKEQGLSGLEWMYGLPGQVGGTVRMNARCYGGEVSEVADTIRTYTLDGHAKNYGPEVFRGYKDTLLMKQEEIVWEVEFSLQEATVDLEKMNFCFQDRKSKGQFDYPSCGCVFKNNYNVGRSSGALLEEVGAKGLARGLAKVSPYHANFVYNQGAISEDILLLTLEMRELVWEKLKIWLEYEMEILGKLPDGLSKKVHEIRSSIV